jgi:predicted amidohydrolase YtcJ
MRAGITAKTTDPPGGRILRDRHGEPTGVLIDLAVPIALAAMPPSSLAERRNSVRKAVSTCLAFGLTEVHDMGVDAEGIDLYRSMIQDGEFPFRVYVAVEGSSRESWERWRTRGPEIGTGGGKLTVRALKMYADGALGSRGAALIEPYADDPGNRGLTLTSKGDLLAAARDAIDHGFQLCTHAIGDRANAIVLDVYTLALHGRKGAYDDRFRIEHAQVLAPTDIPRFAALGVLPVMQATHCTSDMPWAEERLGADRSRGAYAWRSLLATGTIIPGGSDFPVESPDPLLGFYASITRQDAQGNPPGGWFPEQTMTREEALRSITLWGAYAAFQENEKGSLEAGKWADLTVLSKDIMKIPPKEILSTRVAMTMVAGSIVYQAPGESLRLP